MSLYEDTAFLLAHLCVNEECETFYPKGVSARCPRCHYPLLPFYDYYTLFSLTPQAPIAPLTLKKRYKQLSLKFHPDVAGGNRSLFQLSSSGFALLQRPEKAAEYLVHYRACQAFLQQRAAAEASTPPFPPANSNEAGEKEQKLSLRLSLLNGGLAAALFLILGQGTLHFFPATAKLLFFTSPTGGMVLFCFWGFVIGFLLPSFYRLFFGLLDLLFSLTFAVLLYLELTLLAAGWLLLAFFYFQKRRQWKRDLAA